MNLARAAVALAVVSLLAGAKPAGREHRVGMKGLNFAPATVEVRAGDVVAFENDDFVPHQVASAATPPAFDSGDLPPGKTFRFTVPAAGTFDYLCRYHSMMHGRIQAR